MKAITILNITYSDKNYCDRDGFFPISAGTQNDDIQNDDTGDNISDKNPRYGELTAVYWAWKNLKNVDIIGMSHYRRYLMTRSFGLVKTHYEITWKDFTLREYNLCPFIDELYTNDFVLARRWHFEGLTIREQFLHHHPFPEDLETLKDVLGKFHPEVLDCFENYLQGSDTYTCCLFVTTWNEFDKLCAWMFPILFELEKRLDFTKYDKYQMRMIAFLYERLLNVYFVFYHKKTVEHPFYYINDQCKKSIWRQNLGAIVWFIILKCKKALFLE